jgi:hypothetical protein
VVQLEDRFCCTGVISWLKHLAAGVRLSLATWFLPQERLEMKLGYAVELCSTSDLWQQIFRLVLMNVLVLKSR